MPEETAERLRSDTRVCTISITISLASLQGLAPLQEIVPLQEAHEVFFYVIVARFSHAALDIYDYINRRRHTPFVFSEDLSDKPARSISLDRISRISGCSDSHS